MLQIIIGVCLTAFIIRLLYSIHIRDKAIRQISKINLELLESNFSTSTAEKLDPNLIDKFFKEEVQESYPCNLLLTRMWADDDAEIYDFSKYEENHIIMLTSLSPKHPREEDPPLAIVKDTCVHLMKDGSYLWDIRDV